MNSMGFPFFLRFRVRLSMSCRNRNVPGMKNMAVYVKAPQSPLRCWLTGTVTNIKQPNLFINRSMCDLQSAKMLHHSGHGCVLSSKCDTTLPNLHEPHETCQFYFIKHSSLRIDHSPEKELDFRDVRTREVISFIQRKKRYLLLGIPE